MRRRSGHYGARKIDLARRVFTGSREQGVTSRKRTTLYMISYSISLEINRLWVILLFIIAPWNYCIIRSKQRWQLHPPDLPCLTQGGRTS